MFKPSVGMRIPLLADAEDCGQRITSIRALINGTTNYILTSMANSGAAAEALRKQGIEPVGGGGYSEALAAAQELGYAEPDPTNDVEGFDAAYKLAIMATLGFRTRVRPSQIHTEGITKLTASDFQYAQELGYVIKLLAIAERTDAGILARVAPVFLPGSEPLSKVDGVYNAVQIVGDLTGTVLFQGRGAGAEPTSSAVVADLLDLSHAIVLGTRERKYWGPEAEVPVPGLEHLETRYYVRVTVSDRPGVLAQIARTLGDHSVSIAAVNQKEADAGAQTRIGDHDAPGARGGDAGGPARHRGAPGSWAGFIVPPRGGLRWPESPRPRQSERSSPGWNSSCEPTARSRRGRSPTSNNCSDKCMNWPTRWMRRSGRCGRRPKFLPFKGIPRRLRGRR